MTKIYLVRGNLSSLKILEIELIKITPEQLRVEPKSVKVVWNGGIGNYPPYISSRLQRHRENYFDTLLLAIDEAIKSAQRDLERAEQNVRAANAQIASLAVFAHTKKETADAN